MNQGGGWNVGSENAGESEMERGQPWPAAITVKKGQRDIIKAAAENAGVSLNRYVVEAIEARMAEESEIRGEK